MSFLTEWIMNIIVFILLAMVVDMLLPNSNLKKYTKMVIGLLLIAMILTPLLKIVTTDFDQVLASFSDKKLVNTAKVENLIENKKKEIQASNDAYTLEYMEDNMKKDVEEELIDQYGKTITDLEISIKKDTKEGENQLDKVVVYLANAGGDMTVSVVKPIDINTDKPVEEENSAEKESILSTLSSRWNITEQQVELHIERGD